MASTRVRWEYRTLRPPRSETKKEAEDPQDELNEYGEDGWELAGTIEYTGGGTKFLVFKRPVETEDSVTGASGETTDGRPEATDDTDAEEDAPP